MSSQPPSVGSMLTEAGSAKSILIDSRTFRRLESPGESLIGVLRLMWEKRDLGKRTASSEILGNSWKGPNHPTAWLDLGDLYEALIANVESEGPADYIFCLDPWVAQLLGPKGEARIAAKWVFVSDIDKRRTLDHEVYWEDLGKWFSELPFVAILPSTALGSLDSARTSSAGRLRSKVFLQSQGAWQWLRLSADSRQTSPPEGKLLFIVRSSGTLMYLRVMLESVIRQSFPKERLEVVVLTQGAGSPELSTYLKWLALACSQCRVSLVEMSDNIAWRSRVNQILAAQREATLVLTHDRVLLSESFSQTVAESAASRTLSGCKGVMLGRESTAHILTGNLDPIRNYGDLLSAHAGTPAAPVTRGARVIPAALWSEGGGEWLERISSLQEESGVAGPPLLEMVDL
jgi:hypothetical protein